MAKKSPPFPRTKPPLPKARPATRRVAVYRGIDIVSNDHGGVMMGGVFEYEDGSVQGVSQFLIDNKFLIRFLDVFGVEKLSQVNGKACWVTLAIVHGDGLGGQGEEIVRLDPLIRDHGQPFDLRGWVKENRDARGLEDLEEPEGELEEGENE
jgi:hypothetical protein